ncbi:MAG: glycoside hydrolase family 92 protein [Nitrospirae bacterium]|nr:glycoside hydrolase family 92 protein [Nitrospirota bacterium]
MRRGARAIAALTPLVFAGACSDNAETEPESALAMRSAVSYVDPLIGSGGGGFAQGNAFPGATAPFGMVKVGPDTAGELAGAGFAHTAGYWYYDSLIQGFSHTHMHGTGVADYGSVLFMPTLGMSTAKLREEGYASRFSRDAESAAPGYYSVTLDNSIRVELTATERAAHHRYTFPASDEATVLVDLGHALGSGKVTTANMAIDAPAREISGWLLSAGDFVGSGGAFKVYFSAVFLQPFERSGVWIGGDLRTGVAHAESADESGVRLGGYVQFAASPERPIEVQVGISYTGVDAARVNRETEVSGMTFEDVRADTETRWEALLRRIEVFGGTEPQRRMFYTALYHTLLMPTLFIDAAGTYMGLDLQVHRAEGFRYHTDFSLWDTYRTLHPLLLLAYPEIQRDLVVSLVKMSEEGGILPRWPLATHETSSMVGSPADFVIAESYLKGVRDFDVETAYEKMKLIAESPPPPGAKGSGRNGIRDCIEVGYCPADRMGGSVSLTQEYAYADFAIALLAGALGRSEDRDRSLERSLRYRLLWDPQTEFFRPRTTSGAWADPDRFDPDGILQDHYVEGNAWQYLWLAPHDVRGLVELFGGGDALLAKLDRFFELSRASTPQALVSGSARYVMPDPYYWHGNEPDMHAAYVYTLTGRPSRGVPWIRWILETKYSDGPDGLNGNDDAGTLSAWYVFSAIGLYPLAGTDIYLVGSPVFERAVVNRPDGLWTLDAPGAAPDRPFVQSARLGNRRLARPWLRHADLQAHRLLRLEMGVDPSTWGESEPLDPVAP